MKAAVRLIIANVAIFAILKAAWFVMPADGGSVERLVAWLALPADPSAAAQLPSAFLTYMFTHIDFWHLLVNSLWLAWFGALLAEIAGWKQMTAVYFAGGIAGAVSYVIFSAFFSRVDDACLVGASAATLAVVSATLIAEPGKKVRMAFIGTFSLRKLAVAAGVVFLLACLEMAPQQTAAHIGGIAAGVILAFAWKIYTRRNIRLMEQRTRRHLDRLDLMEKARRVGYASLTEQERILLFDLSSRRDRRAPLSR